VAYVEDMVRRRGYALMYHGVLAKHDLTVLKAADNLFSAANLEQRTLDRKTRGTAVCPEPDRVAWRPGPHRKSHSRGAGGRGHASRDSADPRGPSTVSG